MGKAAFVYLDGNCMTCEFQSKYMNIEKDFVQLYSFCNHGETKTTI